jgi:hypothetical protein
MGIGLFFPRVRRPKREATYLDQSEKIIIYFSDKICELFW